MKVSDLDKLFEIVQYKPDVSGNAMVDLVGGTVRIRIPYHFRSTSGATGPKVMVDGIITESQLAGLKAALISILQATNAAIEAEHGWTKYTGDE